MNFRTRLLSFVIFLFCLSLHAQDKTTSMVFSGQSGEKFVVDLSVYDRIYLNEDSFTITSTTESVEDIELLYSLFNHLEFNDETPLDEDVVVAEDTHIRYFSESNSLFLESNEDNEYTLGIFDVAGMLKFSSKVKTNTLLNLTDIPSGVYIAVAYADKSSVSLKFIIK